MKRSRKVGKPVARVTPFKERDGLAGLRLINNEKIEQIEFERYSHLRRDSNCTARRIIIKRGEIASFGSLSYRCFRKRANRDEVALPIFMKFGKDIPKYTCERIFNANKNLAKVTLK